MSDMPEPDIPPLPSTDNPSPRPASDIPPLDPVDPLEPDAAEREPTAGPAHVPFVQPPGTQ